MQLTKTELEIVRALAEGSNSHHIADTRFRSRETIKSHIKNAREKLGAKNIAHLIYLAMNRGIIHSIFFVLILSQIHFISQRGDKDFRVDDKRRLKVSRSFSIRSGRIKEDML